MGVLVLPTSEHCSRVNAGSPSAMLTSREASTPRRSRGVLVLSMSQLCTQVGEVQHQLLLDLILVHCRPTSAVGSMTFHYIRRSKHLLQHKGVQCTRQNKTSDISLSKFRKMNSIVEVNLMIETATRTADFERFLLVLAHIITLDFLYYSTKLQLWAT